MKLYSFHLTPPTWDFGVTRCSKSVQRYREKRSFCNYGHQIGSELLQVSAVSHKSCVSAIRAIIKRLRFTLIRSGYFLHNLYSINIIGIISTTIRSSDCFTMISYVIYNYSVSFTVIPSLSKNTAMLEYLPRDFPSSMINSQVSP